jgi:hypothetical protein
VIFFSLHSASALGHDMIEKILEFVGLLSLCNIYRKSFFLQHDVVVAVTFVDGHVVDWPYNKQRSAVNAIDSSYHCHHRHRQRLGRSSFA